MTVYKGQRVSVSGCPWIRKQGWVPAGVVKWASQRKTTRQYPQRYCLVELDSGQTVWLLDDRLAVEGQDAKATEAS